jgi:threonine aldolase
VQARPLIGPKGAMDLDEMESAIRTANVHHPRTTMILVENTHNFAGGTVLPLAWHRAVRALADRRGLRVHLDGARLFNAAVAAGVPAWEFAATADSTMFCLSKGLGAPVGSMLVGTRAFIDEARRARKLFGGGMRQVGIVAAPAIVAISRMTERLAEDHRRARTLWEGLRGLRGLRMEAAPPETNLVFGDVEPPVTAAALAADVARYGVLVVATGPQRFRLVTHYDVDDAAVERALGAFRETLA